MKGLGVMVPLPLLSLGGWVSKGGGGPGIWVLGAPEISPGVGPPIGIFLKKGIFGPGSGTQPVLEVWGCLGGLGL